MPKKPSKPIKNKKLRAIRIRAGMSQEQLAEKLGIKRNVYRYLESEGNLKPEFLLRLSEIFGLPIEDFIEDAEKQPEFTRLHDENTRPVIRKILTNDEARLLTNYSELCYEAKLMLLGYMDGLLRNQDAIKNSGNTDE